MSIALSLADLGLAERSVASLDPAHVERIAATLDAPSAPLRSEPLPSLWHWAFFTPTTATAGLGSDGHPRLSSPALAPYPRRMWGSGMIEWDADLVVGGDAERTSAVRSVRTTAGGSGSLLIIGLEHEYRQDGVLRLREQQTLLYRDPPADALTLPVEGERPGAPVGGWAETRCPRTPLLFRFSAITFNSHRIHYDLAYAREVEGYPTLVVHGPLTAMTLAGFVEQCTGRRLASFEFKASAPMFADQEATMVCVPPERPSSSGAAQVVRTDGAVAMQATYELRN